jgi:hypothetical protein
MDLSVPFVSCLSGHHCRSGAERSQPFGPQEMTSWRACETLR